MNDKCIGVENKDSIQNLTTKLRLLEQKVEHMEGSMVDAKSLHKMELQISEIKSEIREMVNNREEDRKSISKLNTSMEDVSSRLEEHFESNAKLLIGQARAEDKNVSIEKSIAVISEQIKTMNEKIDKSSIMEQLKIFYNKSVFNKWIGRFVIFLLVVFVISVFSFFMSGGSTFFDIVNQWKELIM